MINFLLISIIYLFYYIKRSLVKDICVEAEANSYYSVTELASYKSTMSSRLMEAKKIVKEDDIKDNNNILNIILDKLEKYKL